MTINLKLEVHKMLYIMLYIFDGIQTVPCYGIQHHELISLLSHDSTAVNPDKGRGGLWFAYSTTNPGNERDSAMCFFSHNRNYRSLSTLSTEFLFPE